MTAFGAIPSSKQTRLWSAFRCKQASISSRASNGRAISRSLKSNSRAGPKKSSEAVRGQVGRLAPRGDRLDDIGGEEGERQEAAEVAIADPLDPGQLGNAAGLTRDERLETAMRPPELLQQDRIGFCRSGRGPLDDQPHLHPAPLDPQPNLAGQHGHFVTGAVVLLGRMRPLVCVLCPPNRDVTISAIYRCHWVRAAGGRGARAKRSARPTTAAQPWPQHLLFLPSNRMLARLVERLSRL